MGNNPSQFNAENVGGPDHPVENVSWDLIQGFLQKLQMVMGGCHVTLPTEAEWEYACRAGTDTPFSFGGTITTAQVNYNGNRPYGAGIIGEYRGQTVGVKALPANDWGLYQMHGNVLEWCADRYGAYRIETAIDPGLSDAMAPSHDGGVRVLRGGNWLGHALLARCASRENMQPGWLLDRVGFRFALRSKGWSDQAETAEFGEGT
jgi:formylglycine-generating enzyme required for sulfatase activity